MPEIQVSLYERDGSRGSMCYGPGSYGYATITIDLPADPVGRTFKVTRFPSVGEEEFMIEMAEPGYAIARKYERPVRVPGPRNLAGWYHRSVASHY